jgi:geranylgeranyl pyrophosphate synthase
MFTPEKNRIETALTRLATETREENPEFADFANLVLEFVRRPGGRLRPALCLVSGEAFGCEDGEALERLAVGLELLHAMALVHDDLIDRAENRRDGPALHRALMSLAKSEAPGCDLALLAGDWLLLRALMLISDAGFKAEIVLRIQRLVLVKAEATVRGAVREIELTGVSPGCYSREDIVDMYRLKTAEYSFVCPLVAGAMAGKASESVISALTRIGGRLGIAYQMRDDLDELRSSQNEDVALRRPTILLWHAWQSMSVKDRTRVKNYLKMPNPDPAKCTEVVDILSSSTAPDAVRREIEQLCNSVMEFSEQTDVPETLRLAMGQIAERVMVSQNLGV